MILRASGGPSGVRRGINVRCLHPLCFGFFTLGICVWLLAAATALAARSPGPGESAAIERAARRDQAFRQYPIKVTISDIEVSTVGPWATAAVVVQSRTNSAVLQELQEVYYRARRRWIGSEDPHVSIRAMPAKVERDLDLSPQGTSELLWVKIVVWVVMGLGAAAILFGIGWLLSLGGGQGATYTTPPNSSPPQSVDSEHGRPRPKRRVPCPAGCQGGRAPCPECGWRRTMQDPTTSVFANCETCGGQLFLCQRCQGAGWIEV